MSNDDLPGTVDAEPSPISAGDAPQSTTAPESDVSVNATTGLDLRGYELSERLGGGGMGDVYRAGDPALGRDLAVKVMKAELQGYTAAEQRFLREARVTGSLQHPGIVPIYNLGRLADGRLHYTMRLVRGRTFADILKDEAGQPERLPALLTIFEKICQAMAYAHSKQVLHRDLKPANVMVGRFGEVQVMDWGLAKLLTPGERDCVSAPSEAEEIGTRIHTEPEETPAELTRLGREMGTPAYMPPEQALGQWDAVDERADVFALGAILCEILTGLPPYSGGNVLRKAKQGDLKEALARLASCGVDSTLMGLCRECLTPSCEGRPRDAEHMAQRVAAYQAEVQERLRRAELERKRRRWLLTAALLSLAGVVGSTWQALRATKAEGQARENEARAVAAADEERQAKELAQARLGQIEKAHELSMSIFRDLDPRAEAKGGPSLRLQLSQRLQRAAKQLDEGAVGDPLTVARLQLQLGIALDGLGKTDLALPLLSKAARTLESDLGPDHIETLKARNALAVSYQFAGRYDEAILLLDQLVKQSEAKLGTDHPKTLIAQGRLADLYRGAGRTADAIGMLERNLKQREAKLGTDHRNTLTPRNNLALAYSSASRTAEALRLHEYNLKLSEAKLGPDHPDTLVFRNNLASAYVAADRMGDALRLNEQTLKDLEAKLGPDHPTTLASRNNLAQTYQSTGRNSESTRLLEQNLKLSEAKLGPDHPSTLSFRHNLALAYGAAGRTAEAIPMHEQNVKLRRAKLGDNHPDTLRSQEGLASAYRVAGRIPEAIRLHEQTLKQCEATLGPDHADTLISRNNLASEYKSAGRITEAIRLYEQNLKIREAKLGADNTNTLISMVNLGAAYRDVDRLKEAISLYETALQRGRKRPGGLPAQLAFLPGALAEIYERAGHFAKAEPIYRDFLEQAQRKFGYDDLRTAATLARLGDNLLKQKKSADAETQLRQCLAIRVKMQPEAWTTFNTRSALGEALLGQKKNVEAEPLLVQGYEGMKQRQDKIPAISRQLRLRESIERLVRLYETTDQTDKAAEWRKKLEEAKAVQKKGKP